AQIARARVRRAPAAVERARRPAVVGVGRAPPLAVRVREQARRALPARPRERQRNDRKAAVRFRMDPRARHAGARRPHVPRALRAARHCQEGVPMNAPHVPNLALPRLSRRAESLGTENAFVVLAEVNALLREGKDIVSFCIGQPDFPTPENVQDAAIAAIRSGKHGYTPSAGIDELRAAAAKDLGARRGLDIKAEDVVVGAGAKPFIAYTIASVTDYGAG